MHMASDFQVKAVNTLPKVLHSFVSQVSFPREAASPGVRSQLLLS